MKNIEDKENDESYEASWPSIGGLRRSDVSRRRSRIINKSKSDSGKSLNSTSTHILESAEERLNRLSINESESAQENDNSTSIDKSDSAEKSSDSTSLDKSGSAEETSSSASCNESDSDAKKNSNSTSLEKSGSAEKSSNSAPINDSDSAEKSTEPEAEVLNFTTNDRIDSIELGEKNIEIIGYVDDIQSDVMNDPPFHRYRYYKIVVNNGYGRRVQVTAWKANSVRICLIERLYTVVHLSILTAQSVMRIYNLGNVDFELLVRPDTEFTTYGRYLASDVYLSSIIDSVNRIGSEIRIEGYIRAPLTRFVDDRSQPYFISAITDGIYVLILRLPAGADTLELEVGHAVSIIGVMLDCHPPKIYVERLDGVKRIPGKSNMPLEAVYLGSKYPMRVFR